jgi:hypothetical protein
VENILFTSLFQFPQYIEDVILICIKNSMKYQVGQIGRVVVARFEDREDVIEGLGKIVQNEGKASGPRPFISLAACVMQE